MQVWFLKLTRVRDFFLSAVVTELVSEQGMLEPEPEPIVQHTNGFYLISGVVWLLTHESLL